MSTIAPPFKWFGGKRRVGHEVWARFGIVRQYIEPFVGAGAVLLARPDPIVGIEVIGDANCHVANFWRATTSDLDAVVRAADYPPSEIDMTARNERLMCPLVRDDLASALADPSWAGDHELAGWWAWGQQHSIGGAWGRDPHPTPTAACAPPRQLIGGLRDRTRSVLVRHGDWSRTIDQRIASMSPTAIFLDPPYIGTEKVYVDAQAVADDVAAWCRAAPSELRIAICGHAGDYDLPGWEVYEWQRKGGAGRSRSAPVAEQIWFSPSCQRDQLSMWEP